MINTSPQPTNATALLLNDEIDLTQCDREPVQFMGAIKNHGVLLVLSSEEGLVLGASANIESNFEIPIASLRQQQPIHLFGQEVWAAMWAKLLLHENNQPPVYFGQKKIQTKPKQQQQQQQQPIWHGTKCSPIALILIICLNLKPRLKL